MDRKRTTNAFIGSPVERIEDFRFLRGRGHSSMTSHTTISCMP